MPRPRAVAKQQRRHFVQVWPLGQELMADAGRDIKALENARRLDRLGIGAGSHHL